MPISTYAELQASVAGFLGERTDLVDKIPEFITLAEETLYGDLRSRENHTRAIAILNEQYEFLPDNFAAIDEVAAEDGNGKRRGLRSRTMAQLDNADYGDAVPEAGLPCAYAIIGKQIRFAPKPDALVVPPGVDPKLEPAKFRHFELVYWTRMPALTLPASTNPILQNFPSLYLYSTLAQAEPYLAHDERVALWKAQYADALARANNMGKTGALGSPAVSLPS